METLFIVSLLLFIATYLAMTWMISVETRLKFMKIQADEKLSNHLKKSNLNK